jgi:hypothetical protein
MLGPLLLKRYSFVLGCILIFLRMTAAAAVTVDKVEYHGWKNAYRISNGTVQLIVLADVGPRIAWYGFVGQMNEFYEWKDQAGKTGGDEYRSYGGHRLWASPETEHTYFPDNVHVSVTRTDDTVRFTASLENTTPGVGLQKEMEIRLDPQGTHVSVVHRITNRGGIALEMAPWALTQMEQGGRAVLPFPPKESWNQKHLLPEGVMALWTYTDLSDPRWTLGRNYLQLKADPNPTGKFKEQMTGIYDPAGWGAYFRKGHLFVKRATVEKGATYPDFGCNFETYTEPGFLELETLGPLRELRPGATALHVEDWWLFKDVPAGEGDDWVDRAVVPLVNQAR